LLQVFSDPGSPQGEVRLRTVKFAVVLQTVDTNLEAGAIQKFPHRIGNAVIPFRDKIEARPESMLPFEVPELLDP
jgi:hypothetical protein